MPIDDPSIPEFTPKNRQEWRAFLEQHHESLSAVWLVYNKKASGLSTVAYSDAVDEALCFGWIDSTMKSIDEYRYKQFFCPRKPKSTWSKVNKAKVERLIAEGLMRPGGLKCIEVAKANGSWSVLDEVEELMVPPDLQAVFDADPEFAARFERQGRTAKRNFLLRLLFAKRPETRLKRIQAYREELSV